MRLSNVCLGRSRSRSSGFIINCTFYCLSLTCTQRQARASAGLLSRILGLFLSESFFPPVPFFSVLLLVHNLIIFLRESETQQRFLCVDAKLPDLGYGLELSSELSREGGKTAPPKAEFELPLVSAFWCPPHPHSLF